MDGLGTALERFAAMRPPERPPSGGDDANKVWYLRHNRLFVEATEAGVLATEHLFTMCEMPRGTRVFDLGDTTRIVYMVKRGAVRIARETPDGKDVTVALLGAGDFFGEETLFDDRARTTVAVVVEDALLCTVRADDLFALLAADPALAINVAKSLSGRLDDARATMEDLAYARVGDRIVHLYRKLAAEHGAAVAGGVRVDLRLTHADVASLVGSTRETVSAEIAKLVDAGRLRVEGRAVVLPTAEMTP
jgi:CRP/FNR family transcriptional regulator